MVAEPPQRRALCRDRREPDRRSGRRSRLHRLRNVRRWRLGGPLGQRGDPTLLRSLPSPRLLVGMTQFRGVAALADLGSPDAVDAGEQIEEGTEDRREDDDAHPCDGGAHVVLRHRRVEGRRHADEDAGRQNHVWPVVLPVEAAQPRHRPPAPSSAQRRESPPAAADHATPPAAGTVARRRRGAVRSDRSGPTERLTRSPRRHGGSRARR